LIGHGWVANCHAHQDLNPSLTLEQKLQRLRERELNIVLQTAQYVKLANGMDKPEPYQFTADYMYLKMNTGIRRLVA
jgi:hypothetical protein